MFHNIELRIEEVSDKVENILVFERNSLQLLPDLSFPSNHQFFINFVTYITDAIFSRWVIKTPKIT